MRALRARGYAAPHLLAENSTVAGDEQHHCVHSSLSLVRSRSSFGVRTANRLRPSARRASVREPGVFSPGRTCLRHPNQSTGHLRRLDNDRAVIIGADILTEPDWMIYWGRIAGMASEGACSGSRFAPAAQTANLIEFGRSGEVLAFWRGA